MVAVLGEGDAVALARKGRLYRKQTVVHAQRAPAGREWRTRQGDTVTAKPGDWLLSDGESEWSVTAQVFDRTYEQVAPDRYRKTVPIRAIQLDEKVRIPTFEGEATAHPGDWLAMNPDGDVWPMPDDFFQANYEPAEAG